ncbi:MAG: hypothetical protein WCF85_11030 [Rhodospirillaceae bacterium]
MNSDPETVGEIRISYELHSFREQMWYRLSSTDYRSEGLAAAEKLYSDGTVDGVRLVRNEYYVDYDFTDSVVIFKRLIGDVAEPDPMAQAVEIGVQFCWRLVSDFFRERGRDELRAQLSRYLEDKRVTTLELIHSEKHAIDLDSAGTVLQGVFQKIAIQLAQTGKISAATLFKDMMSLWSQLVLQLRNDAINAKVPKLEPGSFVSVYAQFEQQFGVELVGYHIQRAVAAYLLDAKNWLEKLDRLGQLNEAACERRHLKILDAQAADIFSMAGPFRELLEEGGDRVTAMCTVASLYGGTFKPAAGSLPRGVNAVNALMNEGLMPRTRSTLRRRFLREVVSRQPLLQGRSLMQELEGLNTIIRQLNESAQALIKDEEVADAMVARCARSLTIQGISESIGVAQKVTEKLSVLSRLAQLAPGPFNKATVFRHFRAVMPPDDLVRICMREASNRLAAVGLLADVQRALVAAPIDDMTRSEMLGAVDNALLDIFKTDILQAPNRSYAERISLLFKVCSGIQLVDGKARTLAVESISREFRNPKFLPAFKQRFRSDAEVKDILLKVKAFLAGDRTS